MELGSLDRDVKVCKFNNKEICTVKNECLLSCPLNPGLRKKLKILELIIHNRLDKAQPLTMLHLIL